MKLAILEVAKKHGGAKNLPDIIALGVRAADKFEDYSDNLCGSSSDGIKAQAAVLLNNPLFIDFDQATYNHVVNNYSHRIELLAPEQPFCLITPGVRYYLIPKLGDEAKFAVATEYLIDGVYCTSTILEIESGGGGRALWQVPWIKESIIKAHVNIISAFLDATKRGIIRLENTANKSRFKNGKFSVSLARARVSKSPVALTATHFRKSYFRVLKHPRFYKDGVVPTDENLLRRVPVKECTVNRDIKKYKAVRA